MPATMNPTIAEYLSCLTVKTLKEIAQQIGFRFISRYRKAELIDLIIAEIDACHSEAIREDKIRTRQSTPKISRLDYPAFDGRVVTEAHVKICVEFGCGSYVKNGMDMGWCPRCGEVTTAEEQITDTGFETVAVIDTIEYPMDHAQFCAWFRRIGDDFEASDAINTDHEEAIGMEKIREAMLNGTAFQPAFMKNDSEKIESLRQSIAMLTDHTCTTWEREVGMSGCSYGCKIYRCEKCGVERELHNATYGCKG